MNIYIEKQKSYIKTHLPTPLKIRRPTGAGSIVCPYKHKKGTWKDQKAAEAEAPLAEPGPNKKHTNTSTEAKDHHNITLSRRKQLYVSKKTQIYTMAPHKKPKE